MNLPITVTVDVAKATAKLSGPLVLGNTYQVTFQGLTEAQAARHPTLVILGRPQLTNQLDEGGRGVAVPTVAAMSTAAGVLALNTQEMADVFSMAGLPPQAVAERACDARKPHAVLPGEVLHGAIRPHAALALHFYVTTQGVEEAGVDTSAESNGATLAQGDCTVHWAPFEFDGNGNPMILRGPAGPVGPMGPAGIVAWPGCLTFQIDADPASPLYGHLIAWAENRYMLYHNGNDGQEGRPLEKHFVVCEIEDQPMSGMLPGHIYQIYYPETDDPEVADHRQFCDLGDVGASSLFAQTLKGTMEASQHNNTSARTLNETSGKTNSLWGILKSVCNNILGITTAFAIVAGAGLFAGSPTGARAEEEDSGIWRPMARPKSVTPDAGWSLLQSDSLVSAWTFTNVIGSANASPNSGNDAPDGHLQIVDEGAFLSENVPPCNEGQGFSLSLGTRGGAAAGTDAAGRSATDYDPLAGAEKFTICAWVYREWTEEDAHKTRTNTAARIFSDISAVDGTGHGVDFRFGGLGKLVIQVNGQYPPKYSDTELVPPFSQTWTHVAVAYDTTGDGGHYWFYVNGYQVQTVRTMNQGAVQANENAVYIGNGSSQNTHHDEGRFIGEIDDVYVFKNWVPDAPGENNLCPELARIMDTHDGNFTTDYEGIGAEPLGDIDPDTPMYSAEQIENILGGVLPTRWLDHATLPGLEITEVLVLGNEGMSSWEEVRSGLLPATYVPKAWDPNPNRPRYEVGGTVNFTGKLGLGGTYIFSWDDLHILPAEWDASLDEYRINANLGVEGLNIANGNLNAYGDADIEGNLFVAHTAEFREIAIGNRSWNSLPDMSAYASTSSVATVASNLAAHAGRTDNPHSVTLVQAFEADPDGALDDFGIGVSPGDGIAELKGFGRRISLEEALVEGDFDFADRPSYTGVGLATTNELAAAVDAAEERVGAVEGMLEEYWCKWSTESLSPLPATNYIPTNWPARKVYCVFANDQTVEFRISLPDNWYPDESCELHLVLWKMLTNSPSISVYAEGGAVTSLTGTSITGREGIFRYRPGYGWIFTSHAYTGAPYNIRDGVRRQIQNATWPNDEKFTPVIQGAVQLLSTPSLQSLRPSLSSSAPLALDAAPATLEDLAPEDFIDEDFTDPDAAPDALDSDESDDLEDAPEEDTP